MYLWFLRNKMALFKLRLSFPIQKKKKKGEVILTMQQYGELMK